jgi:hypothetical protein
VVGVAWVSLVGFSSLFMVMAAPVFRSATAKWLDGSIVFAHAARSPLSDEIVFPLPHTRKHTHTQLHSHRLVRKSISSLSDRL